ncbi:hypothetical protein BDE02_12G054200 [Populus trichocarpa]|nr:hypothetical protein BDE02_12G054200 [Populus trichocarpa]
MVCLSCAMGLWLFYTNGLDFHCLFGRHVVAFIFHFFSVFFPLPLHLCFLSFSQWSSCGWNPVNVVCFSVFYSLWQTPYALRFRMLFVALFVTLSLQSLCYRHACMPVVCFRQGDVFHMEVDYAGLALQLNGDSVLLSFMVAKHLQVCFVQNSIEALFLASAFEIF